MSSPDNLFDLTEEYSRMLNQGLKLSGEDQAFFIEGRLRDLARTLAGRQPRRILDFGCGLGHTAGRFSRLFPKAEIVGGHGRESH